MDKEVERVRPEYLDPIGKKRSGFPWLLVIGAAVAVLAVLGARQHIQTQAAWETRFTAAQKPVKTEISETREQAKIDATEAEERLERLTHIRMQREQAQTQKLQEESGWRCIDGTPFRKIEGGWENVPGKRC